MGILPVINCADIAGVKEKIELIKTFLPEGNFIHIDIADGSMTFNKTWNDPATWANLRAPYALEVHLMVEHPERVIGAWIAAGARRFVIHIETVTEASLVEMLGECSKRGIGLALSSNPETTIDKLAPYLTHFVMFQVLAVHPGLAGQPFMPLTLEKIAWLRREYPHAIIEVDGGINAHTARSVKDAGADLVVSSSYLFGTPDDAAVGIAENPKIAYEILRQV